MNAFPGLFPRTKTEATETQIIDKGKEEKRKGKRQEEGKVRKDEKRKGKRQEGMVRKEEKIKGRRQEEGKVRKYGCIFSRDFIFLFFFVIF